MTAHARALLGAASLGVLAAANLAFPSSAAAQAARTVDVNLPAMPMAEALQAIAAQTGETINYDPDAVKGLTSRPVRGATNAERAVKAAIHGSGLTVFPGAKEGLVVVNDIVVTARRDEAETSVLVRQSTTSDRNGLGLRNQPRNTQVISAKTIEEQQALNITDILRNAGGVSTLGNSPNSGASYTIRGFSAGGLVNGLTTTSQYGVNAGADQPVANIERVEVLKGPDALLAGFGNLGGNVNVVTKKPSAEERLAVSFDTGSFGLVRGVIDANNAITADNKLSGRVIASAQTMDHNYGGYTGDKNWLFAPTLRYKDRLTDIVIGASINEGTSGIGAFTLFDNKTRQIIDRDPSRAIYASNQGIRINTTRFYFDATRQIMPGIDLVVRGMHDKTELTTRAAGVGYSRAGALVADTQGAQQDGSSNAIDSFVRIKTHIGDGLKTSFNVGYNYSDGSGAQRSGRDFNRATNPSLDASTPLVVIPWTPFGNVQIRNGGKQEGIYGQALVEFWKIKILAGVRKNWFESTSQTFFAGPSPLVVQRKDGVSPSGGIIFDATDNLSIFANYARGEQATFTVAKDGSILPNIITTNKEAGVKLDLFQKRATINASYFDIQQDNIIVRDPADPTNLFPGPGQRGRGLDLNIAGQLLPGWTVLASLTRTKYALLTTNALQTVVANQPRDTYSVYSTYRTKISDGVNGGVSAGLYGRSSSYANLLGQYVVPASRQIDANAFLSVHGFDINIGIRNIFDRRNYGSTSVFTYVPVGEPRSVRLSISKRLF
ncbi:TonB-dependent siderophore receptor [Sphingomonas kyeonggiensis]|uniref:Iron complex outermembrane receptor protein n=1 Tax=Sphingomonas kyeonggiensis TaxID=1268553 RepID=A0A7W6JTN6_9SPHN|nr:TonB-dependent receptor [Sphingomonas kyeonggiensis]MBB4099326.1 iron complex outermembrane receptor protein [Sphingomonas kyeonggiensis]